MAFKIKAIDHIQLAAPKGSEEEARHFYATILGCQEIEKPDTLRKNGGVWFSYGSVQIHIGIDEPFVPAKKAHPAFEIQNLKALKLNLENNNVNTMDDNNLPGANRLYAFDPFGNRLEFLEWKNA
ncbi:glyoxalase [Fredinandcohnia sp. QZ13]|uniref:VOC family protein n=1 Tax=Fredinandcohnia sp. QZ13 TaxID=3073144 RepID=UPI00285345FB|nr:VOC family protein [Fredinandcohnia sp. QZ13]MDR4889723.1 glyoxalase [Fredinandcohnia sp. QZ13]